MGNYSSTEKRCCLFPPSHEVTQRKPLLADEKPPSKLLTFQDSRADSVQILSLPPPPSPQHEAPDVTLPPRVPESGISEFTCAIRFSIKLEPNHVKSSKSSTNQIAEIDRSVLFSESQLHKTRNPCYCSVQLDRAGFDFKCFVHLIYIPASAQIRNTISQKYPGSS